jgi:hypothetical protein
MNVRDAATYLSERDFRCSVGTVRALVRAGKLACHRGPTDRGPMQFSAGELDRFLREGLIKGPVGASAGAPVGKAAKARPKTPRPEPVGAKVGGDGRSEWRSKLEAERRA